MSCWCHTSDSSLSTISREIVAYLATFFKLYVKILLCFSAWILFSCNKTFYAILNWTDYLKLPSLLLWDHILFLDVYNVMSCFYKSTFGAYYASKHDQFQRLKCSGSMLAIFVPHKYDLAQFWERIHLCKNWIYKTEKLVFFS